MKKHLLYTDVLGKYRDLWEATRITDYVKALGLSEDLQDALMSRLAFLADSQLYCVDKALHYHNMTAWHTAESYTAFALEDFYGNYRELKRAEQQKAAEFARYQAKQDDFKAIIDAIVPDLEALTSRRLKVLGKYDDFKPGQRYLHVFSRLYDWFDMEGAVPSKLATIPHQQSSSACYFYGHSRLLTCTEVVAERQTTKVVSFLGVDGDRYSLDRFCQDTLNRSEFFYPLTDEDCHVYQFKRDDMARQGFSFAYRQDDCPSSLINVSEQLREDVRRREADERFAANERSRREWEEYGAFEYAMMKHYSNSNMRRDEHDPFPNFHWKGQLVGGGDPICTHI